MKYTKLFILVAFTLTACAKAKGAQLKTTTGVRKADFGGWEFMAILARKTRQMQRAV